jgi:O-acetyl-ADP-ribose deacetylase (regulator of RNase III)
MSKLQYVLGDATVPAGAAPRIVAHVCNDQGGWGAGFVMAISRRWPEPERAYRAWHASGDGTFRLGAVQFVEVAPGLQVANMIGQHGTRVTPEGPPIRYEALAECLAVLATRAVAESATVHMPRIGCGLAGGEWSRVVEIITTELISRNVDVVVYDLAPTASGWELWRQDDGGNQFLIESFSTREAAERMMKVYEDRGHKQVYWIKMRPEA